MNLDKERVARSQLGTALSLYIDDLDPISVHCLACGGGEIAETLTHRAGRQPFFDHALAVVPGLTQRELRTLRNQYWNAFKHALHRDGSDRQDALTLAGFRDDQNDHALFVGWYDLALATGKMPIEAQVFQAWYFAKYPEKLDPSFNIEIYARLFPGVKVLKRAAQKALLRAAIAEHRTNADITSDPKTENLPLILGPT